MEPKNQLLKLIKDLEELDREGKSLTANFEDQVQAVIRNIQSSQKLGGGKVTQVQLSTPEPSTKKSTSDKKKLLKVVRKPKKESEEKKDIEELTSNQERPTYYRRYRIYW